MADRKVLKELGALTEEELQDFDFIQIQNAVVNDALSCSYLSLEGFTDGQVIEYFKGASNQLANYRANQFIFFRNLAKKYNVSIKDLQVRGGKLYTYE